MFEQDMMENLEAMKVATQKQKALVATVLTDCMMDIENHNFNKEYNLRDQIAELNLIVESIDEIFRSAKYLKEFQEKFEKL
jgi:hypothetical protein